MASDKKLRQTIANIISRPHSVRFKEIEWVMDQLQAEKKKATHGWLFIVGDRPIMVGEHNKGKKTVHPDAVREFRNMMIELDLF